MQGCSWRLWQCPKGSKATADILIKNDMRGDFFFSFSPARPIHELPGGPLSPILTSFFCRKGVSKPHFSCLVDAEFF